MKKRLLITAALAVLLALGLWGFFANFEEVDRSYETPPRGAARTNKFLAAERFVRAWGATTGASASNSRSPIEFNALPIRGTLFLTQHRESLDQTQIERLFAWVQAGGLLITEASRSEDDDPLMEKLGIELAEATTKVLQTTTYKLPFTGERELISRLGGAFVLARADEDAENAFTIDDERGTRVLGFALGQGKVVVFSSLALFMNTLIGKEDHAALFSEILKWHDPSTAVLFFDQPIKLSIWNWHITHAPYVVWAGAAFLLAWLWRIAIRFGPIAPDPLPIRRRLTDHLVASGRFLWREKAATSALDSARELSLRRMQRLVPSFRELAGADQVAALQREIGFSASDARRVIAGEAKTSHDFVALTRHFQQIHRAGDSAAS